ncbi:DUF4238 domain-containing protein [Sphingomonas oligoaromativorans]|uniref:DUF4238 domain-containing protein n=1 Tax=Sphingomonas oligoaromativorans TaxID=575322 RepID=UPI00141E3849|nr:DUF4238 domain-containing protein [Sphingomonas oligoaromativorans]NIJ32805.1 hypothetical protein [Sphingomonas oligoaromativorans]
MTGRSVPPKASRTEKVQPGNPHQLVIRQHIYPKASIVRFATAGGVELVDFKRNRIRRAKPDDVMFCADRAWSHGAETGWMKRMEDDFQALAQLVILNLAVIFESPEENAIRDFYTLWHARAERRNLPVQYVKPNGVLGPATPLTADEIETLEKNGYMTTHADGSFAYRDLNTASISIRMWQLHEALESERWGVIVTSDAEFCVPDTPAHGIIPISPSIALVRNTSSGRVTRANVGEINRAMFAEATSYVFARSLAACPGIEAEIQSMEWS